MEEEDLVFLSDWTDNIFLLFVPESETSKMFCVSKASSIMQIQLSPNQVKKPFVYMYICMCVCVCVLNDLRKPKLFSQWARVPEESQMAPALCVMENTQI